MHMVFVGADFEKVNVVSFRYFKTGGLDDLIYRFWNNHTTVLRWAHDVIQQTTYVVAFVQIETHAPENTTLTRGPHLKNFAVETQQAARKTLKKRFFICSESECILKVTRTQDQIRTHAPPPPDQNGASAHFSLDQESNQPEQSLLHGHR